MSCTTHPATGPTLGRVRSAADSRDRPGDLVPGTVPGSVPETPDLLVAAVAAVPEPRPELLARVLAGLRDLPDTPSRREPASPARPVDGAGTAGADGADGRVLPRRRS